MSEAMSWQGGHGWTPPPAVHGNHRERPRRHPRENVLLAFATLVAVMLVLAAMGTVLDAVLTVGKVVPDWAPLMILVPLFVYFGRGLARAQQRMQAVQITPSQFPQAYAMVVDAAQQFGLKKFPDAYVLLGNGQINAFANGHGRRRYIVIYSDLFEVGGHARNPEALRFIIGHEVGHIAAGHTSYWRTLVAFLTARIPVLGASFSRAQEYTADNHGYAFSPEGSRTGMGLLGAGKYLLREVDFDALCNRATTERGFFAWLVNLTSSHPVLIWRAAALRDRTRPGRLFFRPRRGPSAPAPAFMPPYAQAPPPNAAPAQYGPTAPQPPAPWPAATPR